MSVFVVPDRHINAIVSYALRLNILGEYRAETIGEILHQENLNSYNFAYQEEGDPYYGGFKEEAIADPVWILKFIGCLRYQSCQYPEWEASKANKFLERVEGHAIARIPGYDDAPWEYA